MKVIKSLIYLTISLLFIVCLQISSIRTVSIAAVQIGDVDGNGTVEPSDARLALRASVGLEELEGTVSFVRADYDQNGTISAGDARMILRTAVGLEKEAFLYDDDPSYEITNVISRIIDSPYSDSGKKFNAIIEIKNTGKTPIYLKEVLINLLLSMMRY